MYTVEIKQGKLDMFPELTFGQLKAYPQSDVVLVYSILPENQNKEKPRYHVRSKTVNNLMAYATWLRNLLGNKGVRFEEVLQDGVKAYPSMRQEKTGAEKVLELMGGGVIPPDQNPNLSRYFSDCQDELEEEVEEETPTPVDVEIVSMYLVQNVYNKTVRYWICGKKLDIDDFIIDEIGGTKYVVLATHMSNVPLDDAFLKEYAKRNKKVSPTLLDVSKLF